MEAKPRRRSRRGAVPRPEEASESREPAFERRDEAARWSGKPGPDQPGPDRVAPSEPVLNGPAEYRPGPGGHYFLDPARPRPRGRRAVQGTLDGIDAFFDALQNGPRSIRWSVLATLWVGLVGGSLWLAAHQPADGRALVRMLVAGFFVLLGMALCAVFLLFRDWEDAVQKRSLTRSREQGRMSRRLRDMAGTRVDF